MKIPGLSFLFGKISYKTSMEEDKYRFLVINTNMIASHFRALDTYEFCKTDGFTTEEKAMEYIDEHVPKADRKYIRIYKEIPLTTPTP